MNSLSTSPASPTPPDANTAAKVPEKAPAPIPDISEIIPDFEVLDGDKVEIETILNIPIVVTGWIIGPSKHNKNEDYLRFQFVREGETKHLVCMGGYTVMMDQLREIETVLHERKLPHKFRAVVKKSGRCYKFCKKGDDE